MQFLFNFQQSLNYEHTPLIVYSEREGRDELAFFMGTLPVSYSGMLAAKPRTHRKIHMRFKKMKDCDILG